MVKHTKAKVDFSQKRVKVGRKLPKSLSETQIDVKARKLVIPSQKQITTHVDQGNQREVLSSHMVSDHYFASFSSPLLSSPLPSSPLILSCLLYSDNILFCHFNIFCRNNWTTTHLAIELMLSSLLEDSSLNVVSQRST